MLTKAGVRYDNEYCLIYRLENGKIDEIREYCDFDVDRSGARKVSGWAPAAVEMSGWQRPSQIWRTPAIQERPS